MHDHLADIAVGHVECGDAAGVERQVDGLVRINATGGIAGHRDAGNRRCLAGNTARRFDTFECEFDRLATDDSAPAHAAARIGLDRTHADDLRTRRQRKIFACELGRDGVGDAVGVEAQRRGFETEVGILVDEFARAIGIQHIDVDRASSRAAQPQLNRGLATGKLVLGLTAADHGETATAGVRPARISRDTTAVGIDRGQGHARACPGLRAAMRPVVCRQRDCRARR